MNKKCYDPHYSVSVHKHTDGEISTLYQAQFFVTDAECDTFIVEVFGEDTHLHNHEDSILDSEMLGFEMPLQWKKLKVYYLR